MTSVNEFVNTGYKDENHIPIFVGDTVQEGCNNLISIVEWRKEATTFCLKGLGESYNIRDAHIEWKVLNSEAIDSPMYHKEENIVLSV